MTRGAAFGGWRVQRAIDGLALVLRTMLARRRVIARRRQHGVDRLSSHMLRDIGLSRARM